MAKTKTGRAVIYKGLGHPMEIAEYPVTDPEPGGILIKMRRANICGSDLHIWRGDIDLASLGQPLPVILGHEMVGAVDKLGDGVTTDSAGQPLAEGDRVVYRYFVPCGHCKACLSGDDAACPSANLTVINPCDTPPHFRGAYAEYYYLMPNQTVFKVPDDLTDEVVAAANCALSQVIYGLEKVGLSFGETIAIQGAGGLGIYATAVAKEMGAAKVIIIDGIDERLKMAKEFGADEVIDTRELKLPFERIMKVKMLTGGWGADVVAELVGSPQVVTEGISMLGNGGRYLELGNINPMKYFEFDPSSLVISSKSIFTFMLYPAEALKKALEFLSRAKHKYPFDKILCPCYPLDQINKAFDDQNKGIVTRTSIVP
jgi:D-arabinose 1-dehydrogenase-like Zn-dependent alcohol dehydrogenase